MKSIIKTFLAKNTKSQKLDQWKTIIQHRALQTSECSEQYKVDHEKIKKNKYFQRQVNFKY